MSIWSEVATQTQKPTATHLSYLQPIAALPNPSQNLDQVVESAQDALEGLRHISDGILPGRHMRLEEFQPVDWGTYLQGMGLAAVLLPALADDARTLRPLQERVIEIARARMQGIDQTEELADLASKLDVLTWRVLRRVDLDAEMTEVIELAVANGAIEQTFWKLQRAGAQGENYPLMLPSTRLPMPPTARLVCIHPKMKRNAAQICMARDMEISLKEQTIPDRLKLYAHLHTLIEALGKS